jgi:hypothetical protein
MDQGVLSSPNHKPGKTTNKVTTEVLKSFYNNEASTATCSERDYISTSESGVKIYEITVVVQSESVIFSFYTFTHESKQVFQSLHPCILETVLQQVHVVHNRSLQNIQTNKTQWASPFYAPTLPLNYDLQSTSDKMFLLCLQ